MLKSHMKRCSSELYRRTNNTNASINTRWHDSIRVLFQFVMCIVDHLHYSNAVPRRLFIVYIYMYTLHFGTYRLSTSEHGTTIYDQAIDTASSYLFLRYSILRQSIKCIFESFIHNLRIRYIFLFCFAFADPCHRMRACTICCSFGLNLI